MNKQLVHVDRLTEVAIRVKVVVLAGAIGGIQLIRCCFWTIDCHVKKIC